ncbi:MAG: M1 family aminopeptidase [Chitinophagaceae bacterium]
MMMKKLLIILMSFLPFVSKKANAFCFLESNDILLQRKIDTFGIQLADDDWRLTDLMQMEKKAAQRQKSYALNTQQFSNASNNYNINHYRCWWIVDPGQRFIKGRVTATFNITASTDNIIFDLSDSLKVDSIQFRNQWINFERPGFHTLKIQFGTSLSNGIKDSLIIYYQGRPPSNTTDPAFNLSTHQGTPVLWTLSEPYGSREWWPCRNGLDDKADSIDILITVPQQYFSASNGMKKNETIINGFRTSYWKHRYPIATYLIAIAVTNFQIQKDTIQLEDGKMLPLEQYVYPESYTSFYNSIPTTGRIMRLFENYFGPYPFRNEQYAHTQTGIGGGMEHQTNTFLGYPGESLSAHELGHQWFGDKVTCGSWQDIWLNEGFASLMLIMNKEAYWTKAQLLAFYKYYVEDITSLPDGSVKVTDTTSIENIFSGRLSYNKAAWLLKMLRWKLGADTFYEGVRNYLNDPLLAYSFARTSDLKMHLENASGKDLDEFFKDWFEGEGYPSYNLKWTAYGNKIKLILDQSTSHNSVSFFEMPVPIKFKNAQRDTIVVIDHQMNGQQEILNIGFEADSAFIDPNYELISKNNTTQKLSENTAVNSILIFPNPVQGADMNVLLRNLKPGNFKFSIYNAAGQKLWEEEKFIPTINDFISIPISYLSGGVYWLRMTGSMNATQKFIR